MSLQWSLLIFVFILCPPPSPFIKHQSVNNKWTTMFSDQMYALECSCLKATKCIHNFLCKHFNGIYIQFQLRCLWNREPLYIPIQSDIACKQWPRFLKWTFISSFITLLSKKLFFLGWTHTNRKRHVLRGDGGVRIGMCAKSLNITVAWRMRQKQIPKLLSHWVLILKQCWGYRVNYPLL